jgi:glyoxylate reductase
VAVRIYVTRPIFAEALQKLQREAEVHINSEDRVLSREELISHLRDADGTMALLTDSLDREVLEAAPKLKIIANFAVGFNNIDLEAATSLGILATNTPGALTDTTADFAWALLMAAARRVVEGDTFTRAKKFKAWGPKMFLGHDVHGKTLGLVGLGRIGQAVARRATGFNMQVVFHDTMPVPSTVIQELGVRSVSLEELFRISDFISLHVPMLPETRHLLNDRTFAMMKRTAIVVNTSRGPVVDEKALVRALKEGTIAGAGLDVFEKEPEIEPGLFELNNVVLAPHIASASHETRLKMCMMAADNLLASLKGERPPNLVNPEVWSKRRSWS